MFGNLKKKLTNAIQQYNSPTTTTTTSTSVTNDDDLPVEAATAGCTLLDKYEQDWEVIHELNETNAERAEAVAKQIARINQRMQQQHATITELNTHLAQRKWLSEKVTESLQVIQHIRTLTATTERMLEGLEDLCEECELQEIMLQKQCELSQYKQQKMLKLEDYRKKVALEHELSIKAHEEKLRKIQQERQAVFDSAFQEDLEEFKQHGSIKSKNCSLPGLGIYGIKKFKKGKKEFWQRHPPYMSYLTGCTYT